MTRLVAVIAIAGALHAPGAWAQAVDGDEGFMDMSLPDLSPATVDPDGTYVDPQIRNRGECLDHPGRPAWVMVQPKGMEWRRDLMVEYGQLQIRTRIVETGDCGCDNRYPDWDKFRDALAELIAPFEQVAVRDMPEGQHVAILRLESSLLDQKAELGVDFGRICRGTR